MLLDTLKLFSDTNRLRILSLLYGRQLCVCELEYLLDLTQSNISRHLTKMNKQGVLDTWRENKYSYYKINDDFIKSYEFIGGILDQLKDEEPFSTDWANYLTYKDSDIDCSCLPEMLLTMKSKKITERRKNNEKN